MNEIRIEYSIRRGNEAGDWVEIGFGSSGTWDDIDAAAFAVQTDLQRRSWETSEGMPDPDDVDRDSGGGEGS